MASEIQTLRRRIEHYLRHQNPRTLIRVADFLRAIAKDDDGDIHLLDVSSSLRKEHEQPKD